MDKISNSSSSNIKDSRMLDFSKMQNDDTSSDFNFKDYISFRTKREETLEKLEPKKSYKASNDRNVSKTNTSDEKPKTDNAKDSPKANEIKDDKNIEKKDSVNDNKTKDVKETNETKKTDSKDINKTEKAGNENVQEAKSPKENELSEEDLIYVSANFIQAFKNLEALIASGEEITEEKINELFKDVKMVDASNMLIDLKSQGMLDDNMKKLLSQMQVVDISEDGISLKNLSEDKDVDKTLNDLLAKMVEESPVANNVAEKSLVKELKVEDKVNLQDEIAMLKQDATKEVVPKIVNQEMQNLNQNLKEEFKNFDNDIIEDYSNLTVKVMGNAEKMSTHIKTMSGAAEHIQNFSKIIDEINVAYRANKNTINIKLEPEALGKLTVKIHSESGIVNASFIVENERAKRVLEEQIQQLKDTLVQQGVNISDINVQVGQNAEDFNLHKNIMEASNYSASLDFENAENKEEFEEKINPYIGDDLFNDVV